MTCINIFLVKSKVKFWYYKIRRGTINHVRASTYKIIDAQCRN